MPLFSVVVATRNRPAPLGRALAAIRAQTWPDFEAIVVDDGSAEAVTFDDDPRFRLLRTGPAGHPGSGPARARNAGIDAARGQFLAFCDDDDRWCDPDHLARAAAGLSMVEDADLYFANQIGLSEGRVLVDDWFPDLTGQLGRLQGLGDDLYRVEKGLLAKARGFAHLNVLIARTDLVREVGGFWERLSYEEDLDFYWRLVDRARVIVFRNRVVAQHDIPDPGRRANVSTVLGHGDKWLMRSLAARHAASLARSPEIHAAARRAEGDALRRLALLQVDERRFAAAAFSARQALAARFSWKWAAYTAWLSSRSGAGP